MKAADRRDFWITMRRVVSDPECTDICLDCDEIADPGDVFWYADSGLGWCDDCRKRHLAG